MAPHQNTLEAARTALRLGHLELSTTGESKEGNPVSHWVYRLRNRRRRFNIDTVQVLIANGEARRDGDRVVKTGERQ